MCARSDETYYDNLHAKKHPDGRAQGTRTGSRTYYCPGPVRPPDVGGDVPLTPIPLLFVKELHGLKEPEM